MVTISTANPTDPQPRALLRASAALMDELFPAEDNHYLAPEDLAQDHIRFFAAHDDAGVLLGTIALALHDDWAEIKALYVDAQARGKGVARALLTHAETQGRKAGVTWLRLETGETLSAAVKLYRATGFSNRGPFGDYAANDTSLFMEKHLP